MGRGSSKAGGGSSGKGTTTASQMTRQEKEMDSVIYVLSQFNGTFTQAKQKEFGQIIEKNTKKGDKFVLGGAEDSMKTKVVFTKTGNNKWKNGNIGDVDSAGMSKMIFGLSNMGNWTFKQKKK